MTLRKLAAALALALAARAGAQTFPARSGELGILDVPDAEVAGAGHSHLGAELRFDHVSGRPDDIGPLPAYAVLGLTRALDVGFTMREWGQPHDPAGSRFLFGAAAKLQLWAPAHGLPGLATSLTLDRLNDAGVVGGRLVSSTFDLPVKLAGFAGYEYGTGADGKKGAVVGLAATLPVGQTASLAAEALTGARGPNLGLAVRWPLTRMTGVSLGVNYLPNDEGFRVAVGFAFWPAQKPQAAPEPTLLPPDQQPLAIAPPRFLDDRPHFRLRVRSAATAGVEPRHLQYGPLAAAGAARETQALATKAPAPSLENLAESQLAEQEGFAVARERRVRETAEQLDARERTAAEQADALARRERELADREARLGAREAQLSQAARAAKTPQVQQLESLEAQLSAQERSLAAKERALAPAIDAAAGKEQDAFARENADRQEASRLAASVSGAPDVGQQLELRKQALAARNRQLAAAEVRLVARGERLDALEQSLRSKGERLDTWTRRLDARGDRLTLLEGGSAAALPAPGGAPLAGGAAPATPDRSVFVTVVKSPTSIVRESAPAAGAAPVEVGGAVETAVAAATFVTFASPSATMSELDREAVDKIARVAAAEGSRLLIWARAKDTSLLGEAERRAAEVKTRILAAALVDESRIVTRVTTRPGSRGVDVIVSALRDTQRASAPGETRSALEPGEGGKRQVREAVVAAQASIQACVADEIERARRTRIEGVLHLTVSPQGRVTKVTTTGDDVSGTGVDACLSRASGAWSFPAAETAYTVDVPITVIRGGAAK